MLSRAAPLRCMQELLRLHLHSKVELAALIAHLAARLQQHARDCGPLQGTWVGW